MVKTFLTDKDPVLRYDEQNLTDEQKTQVKANIGLSATEPAEADIPKVFFGSALPQTKDDTVMTFRYISKTEDISGYCKTKAQGSSSLSYPKKNQTVKLYKDADCAEKLTVGFKGWGEQNKFCFKANWIDITHARNIVTARLWGDVVRSRANYSNIPRLLRTSPNQGAIDGFPVKVYANGVYQGRYTINIPKDAWMANMDDSLDNHCILCGESNADDRSLFRAAASIDGSDWSDEVHDTVPTAIKTRWNEAINFVVNSTDEEFIAGIGNYFDAASLVDYYLFGMASCGLDAFGKNQLYMTYDGQKWFATMYDMDSTWGLWWNGSSFVASNYTRTDYQDFKDGNGNLLYIRLASLFADTIQERWAELRQGALTIENIVNRFERFTDIAPPWLVSEDYATSTADGAFTAIPSKETNNIQQIRGYVVERMAWCDNLMSSSDIPAAYTAVSFVESTGKQYIDTGISGGTNAEYEITFGVASKIAVGYEHYFASEKTGIVPKLYANSGTSPTASAQSTQFKNPNNGSNQIRLWASSDATNRGMIAVCKYTADGKMYAEGNLCDTGSTYEGGAGWGSLSWYIFGSHEEGLYSNMRLYRLKMSTNGVLVRDYVPVVRNSDGIAGLYDLATHTFFESATDTPLTAFTGKKNVYRPSIALPSGYVEVVINEKSGVSIPSWPANPSGQNGSTHFELVIPTTDVYAPDDLYVAGNSIANAWFKGATAIYCARAVNGVNYLNVSLPTAIVGTTLEEVNAWLAEHNMVFYVKTA